ncbi:MAG: hypothetical protein ACOYLF_08530 [Blastocatellia bacterium]
MSAMIRPVRLDDVMAHEIERHPFEMERGGLDLVPPAGNVTIFGAGGGDQLRSGSDQLHALQSEVATLRREIHEAERMISLLEQLLRNTQIRERDLRRDLLAGKF